MGLPTGIVLVRSFGFVVKWERKIHKDFKERSGRERSLLKCSRYKIIVWVSIVSATLNDQTHDLGRVYTADWHSAVT